jgi:predicted ABC-type ATPase
MDVIDCCEKIISDMYAHTRWGYEPRITRKIAVEQAIICVDKIIQAFESYVSITNDTDYESTISFYQMVKHELSKEKLTN